MAGSLGNVGSASVTVEFAFRQALAEMRAALAGEPGVEVKVEIDDTQASRELRATLANASRGAEATANVEFDANQVRAEFREAMQIASRDRARAQAEVDFEASQVGAALREALLAGSRGAEVEVDVDFDQRQIRSALRSALRFAQLRERISIAVDQSSIRQLNRLSLGLVDLLRIARITAPFAIVTAIGGLVLVARDATAAVLALGGALSFVSGAAIGLPSTIGALVQGFSITNFILRDITDAVGELGEEIDKDKLALLTPPAQAFARTLNALKPSIIEFQTALQEAALPNFTRALEIVAPLFRAIQPVLVETADIMGETAVLAANLAVVLKDDIVAALSENNRTIQSIARSSASFSEAFLNIFLSARPLIRFLNAEVESFAENLLEFTRTTAFDTFFGRAIASTDQLFRLIGGLGRIIGTTFSEAFPFGIRLLEILNQNTEAFADFLDSPRGRNALRDFFEETFEGVLELGRFVRDVTREFFTFARDVDLAPLIRQLRQELIPAIFDMLEVTTRDLLPALVDATTELVGALTEVSKENGPIEAIVRTLGFLAGAFNDLLKLPIIGDFVRIAINIAAVGFALRGVIGFIGGVFKSFKTLFIVIRGIFRFLRPFVARLGFLGGIIARLAPALAVVGRVLLAVFTGPVGIAIGIATLLASAFTLLWQRSETFRDIVRGAMEVVASAIGFMVDEARGHFNRFREVFRNVVDFVQAIIRGDFRAAGREFVQIIVSSIRAVVGWFFRLPLLIFNATLALGQTLFNIARSAMFRFFNAIRNVVWPEIRAWFEALPGRVAGFISNLPSVLYDIGKSAMVGLLDGLKFGFDAVKDFVGGIGDEIKSLKGPIQVDRKLLIPEGRAIMQGFDKGLRQRWAGIRGWIGSIGSIFKGVISPDSMMTPISNLLLGAGGSINSTLNGIIANQLGFPAGLLANGPAGFLHPTSGWADTLAQVRILEKMFGVGMTSGLRPGDPLQHGLGQAADFGTSRGSNEALTNLATFTSKLAAVFKQVIWLNSLWKGGKPGFGFVPDHMDHVHLGWHGRKAGGPVKAGMPYQWNERGREMLIPQQSGYILNAGRTKELVSALTRLAQKPSQSTVKSAEIHVHSNADPIAVGGLIMSNLGGVFSRA